MSTVDFTASDYLAYRHAHADLGSWRRLTTGRPAVLGEPRAATALAAELARRTGRTAGVLHTSTLHALLDVWSVLAEEPLTALVDEFAYPIGRLALRANGITATVVRHFDPGHVSEVVRTVPPGRRVALLVDGLCPGCGRLAPLAGLIAAAAPRRGLVLVDDTQSIGLAGRPALAPYVHGGGGNAARLGLPATAPDGHGGGTAAWLATAPYGHGGGGTAAWLGLPATAPVVVVASTAKAYGAPLAVLTGPARLVSRVRHSGPARVHGSPPSAAARAALASALATEAAEAARRRLAVATMVRRFRSACRSGGLPTPDGGPWPTQTVPVPAGTIATVHDSLLRKGIRTVVVHRRCRPGLGIAFLITARHTPAMIDQAVRALATASVRAS